ncbi:alpha/beta hydrolase [Rhodoblastus acidophilus]|uniref:Alpha/beta hydrolase n=1 Tax=Candidatus Rhodoblastus alkanivorans TaxID=2954117 RepID=A0ABS9Z6R5_9HYPH|nr:alpha/beta hydrolase [Candidatus Rhodoblastus alkanivorans]MCI4679555.1 alpha/beta hydrolase [Candidatus Rhodoblastus alkanivorans]MCI4683306.1 alpha/beta hydrolase [Candidatus Rhodoblastus alkanivorans]MDI4640619.1 alpha/beta hydrolase [Rhodoblastus acidophilus]
MRLVFIHGWALGPESWDALAPLLPAPQIRVDLGYFGAPDIPPLPSGDILVGHSAGLLWGLRQRGDWAGLVAINSFARFCLDAAGEGCVEPAALRAMRQALERDAKACADNFRAALGLAPAPGEAQEERLMDGLDLLRDFDATPLVGGRPVLVLGAENDTLAPAAASRRLAEISGGALALHETGGHGLPWTAPEFCAGQIAAFLRAHDF